jgi:predicted transcriptional regulator
MKARRGFLEVLADFLSAVLADDVPNHVIQRANLSYGFYLELRDYCLENGYISTATTGQRGHIYLTAVGRYVLNVLRGIPYRR